MLRSDKIDATKIEQILSVAVREVPVRMRSGHGPESGFGITERDAEKFIADAESRPGWIKPEATEHKPNATAGSWSAEEFRALQPLERMKLANRGIASDKDGRIHVVYRAP